MTTRFVTNNLKKCYGKWHDWANLHFSIIEPVRLTYLTRRSLITRINQKTSLAPSQEKRLTIQ